MFPLARTPVTMMDRPYPLRWWALAVLCLSLLIIVMANTSLIVAAPAMTTDLALSSSQLQWVIDGYTVPYAALLLALGAVGDKYSRRGGLLVGLVVFAAGSVFGSLVHTTDLVIGARVMMGVGAAFIMPATLSLLIAMFPRHEQARAITVWTATSGLAIAAGPLLAGLLLERYTWNATFLINLPLVVAALIAVLFLVPPSRSTDKAPLDLGGGLLSTITLGSLVYALIQGLNFGWEIGPIAAAVVAVIGLVTFGVWELRHPHPIMDVRRFREREFSGALLAVLLFFFGTFGAVYYSTQHLQFVLGYSALSTGLRLLPLAAAVFVGAGVTGVLHPRLGARSMIGAGMAIGTAGIFLLTRIGPGSIYTDFLAPLLLLGFAIGLSLAPATDTLMELFPQDQLGVAGGLNDTAIELGATLGIAILGSILSTSYRDHLASAVGARLPGPALAAAKASVGDALVVAHQLAQNPAAGPAAAAQLGAAADGAFAQAIAHTSLIAGVIMAAGTVTVWFVLPGRLQSRPGALQQARASQDARDVAWRVPGVPWDERTGS